MSSDETREFRTYKIPPLEIYEVTNDQLDRIEESCQSLSQDLTFAIASLSIFASFAIALASADPSGTVRFVFIVVAVVSLAMSVYTGCRWFRRKKTSPGIIAKIRSRKLDPES